MWGPSIDASSSMVSKVDQKSNQTD
jgi:hypothetical protein